MSVDAPIFHRNRYHAEANGEHCAGVVRHEESCITKNKRVFYAYEIVADPNKLDHADRSILYALGVGWAPEYAQSLACSPKGSGQQPLSRRGHKLSAACNSLATP